jgi:hypothetical protein
MTNNKPKKIPVCARRKKHIHRDKRVTAWVTLEQKKEIFILARKAGLTVSAWLLKKAGV